MQSRFEKLRPGFELLMFYSIMFNPDLYFKNIALYKDSGFAKTESKKFCDSA